MQTFVLFSLTALRVSAETRSYKKCPQLSIHTPDRGVSVECAQNGYPVDCESYNITWYSGTELKIVCPPNYRANFNTKLSTERRSVPRDSTLCDENGHWIKNNVSCQPGEFFCFKSLKNDVSKNTFTQKKSSSLRFHNEPLIF